MEKDITKGVDGKRYSSPAMLDRRRRSLHAINLAIEHPDWNITQILVEQHKAFPNYTETALRMALNGAGIKRSKPRVYKTPEEAENDPMRKPKSKKPKPAEPIRASVHSYSGRSRLSSGYTEL